MEDKRYNIELEVITPLAVGSDNEWSQGADYVTKDGKIYILDIDKVGAKVDMNRLTSLLLSGDKECDEGLCALLGKHLESVSRYVFDLPVESNNPIKTFLRTQLFDKPIVAGSSIKGALRSILFESFRTYEQKDQEVFGKMKDGTEFMRFVRVSDFEIPSTVLVNTKIFNCRTDESGEWTGGWKHAGKNTDGKFKAKGFNTIYECAKPKATGLGTIDLAANEFDLLPDKGKYASKKQDVMYNGIKSIFEYVNLHTKTYLKKELDFFEKNPAERTIEIMDNITKLQSMIPSDNSYCIMKMSAGSGFHSITGDWQYDDYDDIWDNIKNKKGKKSRKIACYDNNLQLMGFVKLRVLSDEEYKEKSSELSTSHDEKKKLLMQPYYDSLAKKEEDERRLLDAELQAQFDEQIRQIEVLFSEQKWNEAKDKAEQALTMKVADASKAQKLLKDCEMMIQVEETKRNEQIEKEAKFGQSLEELLKNISSIGNLCDTTKKWLAKNDRCFGEEEFKTILDVLQTSFANKLDKELRKKDIKTKFIKAIGQEMTDKLYGVLNQK